jgi:hypothetical protein
MAAELPLLASDSINKKECGAQAGATVDAVHREVGDPRELS